MVALTHIIPALLVGALTFVMCWNAPSIAARLGIVDHPGDRKIHVSATPLMGGVVLLAVVIPITVAIILINGELESAQQVLLWLAAVAAMALVGMADDRHTLSPRDRLLVSFLVFGSAALLDPMFNVRLLSFHHPAFEIGVGTGWLAVIFTTVCCVGLVNAVNMADGKNGLVIGMSAGWIGILLARAPTPFHPVMALLLVALFVLFVFNMKGKLFLGDGGAYGIATAIGLLAIATYNSPGDHAGRAISAEELIILFLVPVLDSFRLTFSRMRRGQSPMAADRDHLHHHLYNRFGWPLGLAVYLALALLPSAGLLWWT